MKYATVIRQLGGHRPVVLCIIKPDMTADSPDHYLKIEAERQVERFKNQFVEFKDANFYVDYIEESDFK